MHCWYIRSTLIMIVGIMSSTYAAFEVSPSNKKSDLLFIAHRGASDYAPENTLSAIKKAIDLGAHAIEVDIRRCKSGELILMHDERVDRTTDSTGFIHDKTADQLRAMSVKGVEKIVFLSELLHVLGEQKPVLVLDFKEEGIADDVAALVHKVVATAGWTYEHFYATGFQHRELQKFAKQCPNVKLIPAIVGTPCTLAQVAQDLGAAGICLIQEYISADVVVDAHKRGMSVWVWTFDCNKEAIRRLVDMKIDALMVNSPDKVRQRL